MPNILKTVFRALVILFAILGAFFVLVIIFVPKNIAKTESLPLVILAPTVTPSEPTKAQPASTPILAPTVTPTELPATPTKVPSTSTPTVAPTSTPALVLVRTNNAANLREGPGTDFPVIGTVQVGTELIITGRTDAGDWYSNQDGTWIAAFLIDSVPIVPTVPPTATPIPTSTPSQLTESQYKTFMLAWEDRFQSAFAKLTELANTPGADLSGVADEWVDVEAELHTILPASGYYNFHQLLITTVESCRDAAINYRDGQTSMGNLYINLCYVGMQAVIIKLETEH